MKKIIMRMLLIGVLCTGVHFFVRAQGPPDGDPNGDPDAVPLDPGSWVLVAAGVGYGVKKWWDAKQNNLRNNSDAAITDLLQEDKTDKNS